MFRCKFLILLLPPIWHLANTFSSPSFYRLRGRETKALCKECWILIIQFNDFASKSRPICICFGGICCPTRKGKDGPSAVNIVEGKEAWISRLKKSCNFEEAMNIYRSGWAFHLLLCDFVVDILNNKWSTPLGATHVFLLMHEAANKPTMNIFPWKANLKCPIEVSPKFSCCLDFSSTTGL